jgi:pimeloyl-ACP methyl ester carboxylesterase
MTRVTVCLALVGALVLFGADANSGGRLVTVGDHRLLAYCSGTPSKTTVVLVNGLGAGLDVWKSVQSAVEPFAKVCSYDRAGEGHSDRIGHLQTPDEVVNDLKQLLDREASGPYILVGWSLGGIYVRHFAQRYPSLTAGIVFVDSSHEEQYNTLAAISPSLAQRYATQDGRFDRDEFLQSAGQLKPGNHLEWHLDVPLIVLEHKRLSGPARTDADRYAVKLHELQADLAGRSKFGKLIETNGGHMIPTEQPQIVSESIRDVMKQAEALRDASQR